jgi:hypothetical protein
MVLRIAVCTLPSTEVNLYNNITHKVSLVPRPEKGGERAWYLLAVHVPTTPGKPGVTL